MLFQCSLSRKKHEIQKKKKTSRLDIHLHPTRLSSPHLPMLCHSKHASSLRTPSVTPSAHGVRCSSSSTDGSTSGTPRRRGLKSSVPGACRRKIKRQIRRETGKLPKEKIHHTMGEESIKTSVKNENSREKN